MTKSSELGSMLANLIWPLSEIRYQKSDICPTSGATVGCSPICNHERTDERQPKNQILKFQ